MDEGFLMHASDEPTGRDLSHLRLVDETWEAVLVKIADLPVPRLSGSGLMVMESATRQIEAVEYFDAVDADSVADAVLDSFLEPEDGMPRQPLALRVADPDIALALERKLSGGPTAVEIAPCTAAVERLTEFLTLVGNAVNEVVSLPTASSPAYFRAAATLYNAKPWTLLEPDHKLRLHFSASDEVFFAALFAEGPTTTLGLDVFRSEADFDRAFRPDDEDEDEDEDEVRITNSLSIYYLPEREVAEVWREQRRHARWVIAGPDAFPLPAILDHEGEIRDASAEDLWILAQAAAAIAGFVARNRKRLANREACTSRIDVSGPTGKTTVEVSYTPTVDEVQRALQEVVFRATVLPEAGRILQRLRWTFFRAPVAHYAHSELEATEALGRFLAWCVFAAEHFAVPLAEQIRAIARAIQVETVDLPAMLTPRISYFDVVEKQSDLIQVRDRRTGELLPVRRSMDGPDLLPGEMIVGPLHDTGRGDYVLSLGSVVIPEAAGRGAPKLRAEDLAVLGPATEGMFGATADWLEDIPPKEVREWYEQFRSALHATGDDIPSLGALQKTIAKADSPGEVLRDLIEAAKPWGEGETQVISALFKRIWNFTPRPELNGRSPDQMRQS
jgi:hypothetical protein